VHLGSLWFRVYAGPHPLSNISVLWTENREMSRAGGGFMLGPVCQAATLLLTFGRGQMEMCSK
jgi:hypothetical protein